jgi:glycosyltransferase involved in cell wall biosynthesis
MPLISVILPVCNGAPYVIDAVHSIQNQTVADFELLAIDDGSTDGSQSYLHEAARRDSRISVISNANKGLVEALNLGLKLARGEFIARMDADDVSAATRFEHQIEFLGAAPGIAVVGSALTLINSAGRAIGASDYPTEPAQVHAALERMDCAVAHGSVMARRSVITSVGGYRAAFRHAEDYDLWLRVAEHYRIGNLSKRLMRYRCHGNSVSQRHHYEQRLATHVALLCARERRSGRPDPMLGATNLSLADLLQLDVAESQRAIFVRSILEEFRCRIPAQPTGLRARLGALMRNLVYQWRGGKRA